MLTKTLKSKKRRERTYVNRGVSCHKKKSRKILLCKKIVLPGVGEGGKNPHFSPIHTSGVALTVLHGACGLAETGLDTLPPTRGQPISNDQNDEKPILAAPFGGIQLHVS